MIRINLWRTNSRRHPFGRNLRLVNFRSFFNPISIQQGLLRKNGFLCDFINVSLTYKIISLGPKGPVLTLRITNTQEKVRHVEPRKRNRTKGKSDKIRCKQLNAFVQFTLNQYRGSISSQSRRGIHGEALRLHESNHLSISSPP